MELDYRNLNGDQPRRRTQLKSCVMLFGMCFLSVCLLAVGLAFYFYVKDHGSDATTIFDDDTTAPVVNMPNLGKIYGVAKLKTNEYLGIPYAQPPIGSLRWQPPQPYTRRFAAPGLTAHTLRPSCYQATDVTTQPMGIAEDCLYLNVFTPAVTERPANGELSPVLFFVHGGNGIGGGAAQSIPTLYNGTNMIYSPLLSGYTPTSPRNGKGVRNVIVVTINYRLGPFAQLYLPSLANEDTQYDTSGMYHHLDIQMALKWVHDHIKLFGGDAQRVTIFGESTGANLALTQTLLKGSNGLIHRAISQSGTWGLPLTESTLQQGKDAGARFITLSGCTGTDVQILTCLRTIPAAKILELAAQVGTGANSIRGMIDGKLLADYPSAMLSSSSAVVNKVPIVWGTNKDERYVPLCPYIEQWVNITEGIYNNYIKTRFAPFGITGANVDRIIARFGFSLCVVPGHQPETRQQCCELLETLVRDYMWTCNTRRMVHSYRSLSTPVTPVYNYRFTELPICPAPPRDGLVDHTEELAYVFGTRSTYVAHGMEGPCGWNDKQKDFSYQMSDMWAQFALTGSPSIVATQSSWSSSGINDTESYMTLQQSATRMSTVDRLQRDRCDSFWDPFARDLIDAQRHGKL